MQMSIKNATKSLFNVMFTIYGEPASKANSRKLVMIKGRMIPIKSQKALNYVKEFQKPVSYTHLTLPTIYSV